MHIKIPFSSKEDIAKALKKKKYEEEARYFSHRYVSGRLDAIIVEIKKSINKDFILTLQEIGRKLDLKGVVTQCTQLINIIDNSDNQKIVSMRALEQGLIEYFKKDAIKGWLYQENKDGSLTPYLVEKVKYSPADTDRSKPESVEIVLISNSPQKDISKQKRVVGYHAHHVNKKTIAEILAARNLYKESNELNASYDKSIEAYQSIQPRFGSQFLSSGKALCGVNIKNNERELISLNSSKGPQKLVNDESVLSREYSMFSSADFWHEEGVEDGLFEEIPFEPYLYMFNLSTHKYVWVHASEVQEYKYNKKLKDKLILPEEHSDLIDILVDDMDVNSEDIITGKAGGSIILCMGSSGLGKTLTAEIYAEIIERPLYSVHSGQLGTNPDTIEERLDIILRRAERLGVVLLLDEADVYIRERDNSMSHNAIVAAFLRKLEYFNGLLFMTTNRYDDVDDAIISRCIAILRYLKPDRELREKLWKTLSKQFKVRLTPTLREHLIDQYPDVSGRDIKNLLDLAAKSKRVKGSSINIELFRKCAMFRGISSKIND